MDNRRHGIGPKNLSVLAGGESFASILKSVALLAIVNLDYSESGIAKPLMSFAVNPF